MRNGDYVPNRLEAQTDAAIQVAARKRDQNPENTVGVLTMAGRCVEVRVALTPDVGRVLSLSHGAKLSGEITLSAGIQVAQLALFPLDLLGQSCRARASLRLERSRARKGAAAEQQF